VDSSVTPKIAATFVAAFTFFLNISFGYIFSISSLARQLKYSFWVDKITYF